MFEINKSTYNEIFDNLEINLNKIASDESTKNDKKLIEAVELLNVSAGILEQIGFDKEADILTKLTILAVHGDPHTEHLTSEKMINNLKEKGIMFDANDEKHQSTHEGPDEYKREKLEEEYLEEMLENDYDKILGDLDDEMQTDMDEVII